MRIKKTLYFIVLFLLPIFLLCGIIYYDHTSIEDAVFEFTPVVLIVLGCLLVLHIISFIIMFLILESSVFFAYLIPACAFISFLYFRGSEAWMLLYAFSLPTAISTFVYTTGFLVYRKWINKAD